MNSEEVIVERANDWQVYPSIKLCQIVMRELPHYAPSLEKRDLARSVKAASIILKQRNEDCSAFQADIKLDSKVEVK